MKNIVHISNFNLMRLKGCFQNGFPIKISNGLIRNGYAVLNYPDRDLCRMFGFGHMKDVSASSHYAVELRLDCSRLCRTQY